MKFAYYENREFVCSDLICRQWRVETWLSAITDQLFLLQVNG